MSARDIGGVLAGRAAYDDLGAREQAVVRAEWDEQMTALRTGLNFADEFSAAGDVWSEADADGRAVERDGEQHVARGATPRRRRSVR